MSSTPWRDRIAGARLRWAEWDVRRRVLALVVAGSLALALGAWGLSLAIESPQEAAANAAAPPPSLIVVPVEKRQVGEEIVTRGIVTATQTVEAVSEFAGSSAARALISGRLPATGDVVSHGAAVIEISGRPVIVLQGDVPAYRSLNVGDTGSDVRQLNAALAAAGQPVNSRSRTYDDATRAGVVAVQRAAGYVSDGALAIGEVVFVSSLPASVVSVSGELGTSVAEASVQIASGELAVTTQFSGTEAGLVQPGAAVVISSELLGKSVEASVEDTNLGAKVADDRATNDAAADSANDPAPGSTADPAAGEQPGQRTFRIVPHQPLDGVWAGQDVKVRVVSAETSEKVLAVPVTAIVSDASGETQVVVVRKRATSISDADPRRVRVKVGVAGGGWVEVTPAQGETLSVGDPVQLSAPAARP